MSQPTDYCGVWVEKHKLLFVTKNYFIYSGYKVKIKNYGYIALNKMIRDEQGMKYNHGIPAFAGMTNWIMRSLLLQG